jgi:hypothetical protein
MRKLLIEAIAISLICKLGYSNKVKLVKKDLDFELLNLYRESLLKVDNFPSDDNTTDAELPVKNYANTQYFV